MADTRKIVKVFLASPGDLGAERKAAKATVDQFNATWADHLGYHVELVGWEDTVSVYGRPQEAINNEMATCELFIGILWKKWGTAPSTTGPYSSGFEEEFELSCNSREQLGRPEISLYLKNIDATLLADPGKDLERVIAFKNKIIARKNILYETFDEVEEFKQKSERCISRYIQKLMQSEALATAAEAKESPPESDPKNPPTNRGPSTDGPLSYEGTKFLSALIADQSNPSKTHLEPTEVARFRLLASIVQEQGNDNTTLGVHDANLLYLHRSAINVGRRERFGLLKAGLNNFADQTVPLWTWWATSHAILSFQALSDSEVAAGALSAMRLIRDHLVVDDAIPREAYLSHWFAAETATNIKVAALSYLGECGLNEDLPEIRAELGRANYQTGAAAIDASLRINLRKGHEAAVSCLIELQPETVTTELLNAVFAEASAISTENILKCSSHKSPSVRQRALIILDERDALENETLKRFLSDPDTDVRLEALKLSLKRGERFPDAEVDRLLEKGSKTRTALGLYDFQFERQKKVYLAYFLSVATAAEVAAAMEKESIYDQDALFEWVGRNFSKRGSKLREMLKDRFAQAYEKHKEQILIRYGEDSEALRGVTKIQDFVRQQLTRKALNVLCRKGKQGDLSLVREILASEFVKVTNTDIEFLGRFGKWEDIKLVVAGFDRVGLGGLFSDAEGVNVKLCATAILKMAKNKSGDLFENEFSALISPDLLVELIIQLPNRGFGKLPDEAIDALLHSSNDAVRRGVAQKSVLVFNKGKLEALLNAYQVDRWFYNVVHWLDFGISVRAPVAKAAIRRAIKTST